MFSIFEGKFIDAEEFYSKKGNKIMFADSSGKVVSDKYSEGLFYIVTDKKVGEKWK